MSHSAQSASSPFLSNHDLPTSESAAERGNATEADEQEQEGNHGAEFHAQDDSEQQEKDDHMEAQGLVATKRRPLQIAAGFMPRWILTFAIAASIYGVLMHYSKKPVMSKDTKRGFNTVITGLSIALGLVLVTSFNGMLRDLRWWILSRRYRSRRKVESILRASSMTQLCFLALKSSKHTIHLAVAVWLLIVLGSQIAVASIGLCYSTDAADAQALTVKGDILVADMSEIYTNNIVSDKSRTLGGQQYTANSYGIVSTAYLVAGTEDIPSPGTIFYPGDPFLFENDTLYSYVFRETSVKSSLKDGIWAIAIATSRIVSTSAQCRHWPVKAGGDGKETKITIDQDGVFFNVSLPDKGGTNQTTYLTNTTESCGFGCGTVYAFESAPKASWWYQCNVTVQPVTNATRPEHKLGRQVAGLAASAIALQGYGVSSLAINSIIQFQTYPQESVFGSVANGDDSEMEDILSRFAIGVIAATAEGNDPITIRDVNTPKEGVQVTLSNLTMITVILTCIVVLHFVLEIVIVIWANQIVVPPGGDLVMAQVLRAMTMKSRGPEESDRTGKESAAMKARKGDTRWRYRVVAIPGTDRFDLSMEKAR